MTNIWYPLRLLGLYRAFLTILLAALFYTNMGENSIGDYNPSLFLYSCSLYLLLSLAWIVAAQTKRPSYEIQIYLQISSDIILITLLMHASGGLESGLGILLIISIAASSLLLKGIISLLFAAIASLAILAEQAYNQLIIGEQAMNTYPQAGALGAALFGTAALIMVLNRRIQESEALASQRELDLRNLAELNEYVIQHMQSGVIVTDADNHIHLMNQSAANQLNVTSVPTLPAALSSVSAELERRLNLWLENNQLKPNRLHDPGTPFELQPHFTRLGHQHNSGTLIILEDTSAYTKELQNIKLTSLGRLTASIAHEIRNPLSAIQHASQLLNESPDISENEQHLIKIIGKQTRRMNTIIKNIMQLSTHEKVKPTEVHLNKWLTLFRKDFCAHHSVEPELVTVQVEPEDITAYIDTAFLYQISWNLCSNCLKYGRSEDGKLRLQLTAGIDSHTNKAWLEISDQGKGIDAASQDRIFEPFYTTNSSSTGLGLYIVRELCAFNHAEIHYVPRKTGSCFRITFADTVQLNL